VCATRETLPYHLYLACSKCAAMVWLEGELVVMVQKIGRRVKPWVFGISMNIERVRDVNRRAVLARCASLPSVRSLPREDVFRAII
jgi:hypothetical protein